MMAVGVEEVAGCNDWREVDAALRNIARRRAVLDVEEALWIREAERLQIWRPLGMVSALDYLERVLGYTPHVANERLRVARALGELPQIESALARGELTFSAVRELTRVATPETDAAWRAAAVGKNVREIEELVAGHKPGDRPDDLADPDIRRRAFRFELSPEVAARLRQAQAALADEHGARLDDDQLFTAFIDAILDAAPAGEPSGRAKFQIAVTVCARCKAGWQDGAGAKIAIDAAAVDRAYCDAQHIGSLDADVPARASQDIPPAVARLVWRRDGGRCQTPGCRSARGLETHHIIRQADGGSHEPSNLRVQCSACHLGIHRGTLEITGTRDELVVNRPNAPRSHVGPIGGDPENENDVSTSDGAIARTLDELVVDRPNAPRSHVGPTTNLDAAITRAQARDALVASRPNASPSHVGPTTNLDAAITRAQARDALVGLGWKLPIARAAVDEALAACGPSAPIEVLIRESLRRCPLKRAN